MYYAPMKPFQRPPAKPDARRRDPKHPVLKRRGRPPAPLPGLLDNVPQFADMAELDAWIESNMIPGVDHYPVTCTEAEWEWHKDNR